MLPFARFLNPHERSVRADTGCGGRRGLPVSARPLIPQARPSLGTFQARRVSRRRGIGGGGGTTRSGEESSQVLGGLTRVKPVPCYACIQGHPCPLRVQNPCSVVNPCRVSDGCEGGLRRARHCFKEQRRASRKPTEVGGVDSQAHSAKRIANKGQCARAPLPRRAEGCAEGLTPLPGRH